MKKIITIIILVQLLFWQTVFAAMPVNPSYVSATGSGSACTSGSPCALSYANANADDDDVVNLYDTGGTYTTQLNPANAGSSGHPVTFQNYTGDTPTFTVTGAAASITVNYIVIDGLTFSGGTSNQISADTVSNLEVKNCTFSGAVVVPMKLRILTDSWIHNNTFNAQEEATDEATEEDTIWLYNASARNIIEYNSFYDGGGHAFLWISYNGTNHNIIRYNYGQITNYFNGASAIDKAGLDVFVGIEWGATYNLVEHNVWVHDLDATSGSTTLGPRGFPYQINGGTYNIIRNELIWSPRGYTALYANRAGFPSNYNTFYNITIYNTRDFYSSNPGALSLSNDGSDVANIDYNIFKNIILRTYDYRGIKLGDSSRDHSNYFGNIALSDGGGADVYRYTGTLTIASAESSYPSEFAGSSAISNADPKLSNPTSYPTSVTDVTDFYLQSGSTMVDAGDWLTTITTATGSGTSFDVANSRYFMDGWSISGESGDTFQIEGSATEYTITSISSNTITFAPSASWTVGDGISLPYYGAAPDIGAFEYSFVLSSLSPTTQQTCSADPQTVTMSATSPINANCRYSTSSGDTTYASMSSQFTGGEGGTSHTVNVSQACGGSTKYYVICNDGTNDSVRAEITVDVETLGGFTAPPGGIVFDRNASTMSFDRTNGITVH